MPFSGAYQALIDSWRSPQRGLPAPKLVEWNARCPGCGLDAVWRSVRRQQWIEYLMACSRCGVSEWSTAD